MNPRQTNTPIAPLFGLVLMATFASSAFAQPVPAERKFSEDVKYYNPYMAVILETSIYDMYENAKPEDLNTEIMRYATQEPVAEIISDFGYLRASTLPQDKAMAAKWRMQDTTAASWLDWFGARVKVISGAHATDDSFWSSRFEIDKGYPITADSFQVAARANSVDSKGVTIAGNLVGPLLNRAIKAGYALRYKGANFLQLVSGANFGIVQLSTSYFANEIFDVDDPSSKRHEKISYVAIVYRNSVMIHEARHSDGSGEHAGFSHVRCPVGHPFASKDPTVKPCDLSLNGANSVAADFIKLYLQACRAQSLNLICTEDEMIVLVGLITRSESYVLSTEVYPRDGSGKKVVDFLDPAPVIIQGVPDSKMTRE